MIRPEHIERPPLPAGTPQMLILNAGQAADFLNMAAPEFRKRASTGEIPRINYGYKTYRYYVYDLLDWALSQKAI